MFKNSNITSVLYPMFSYAVHYCSVSAFPLSAAALFFTYPDASVLFESPSHRCNKNKSLTTNFGIIIQATCGFFTPISDGPPCHVHEKINKFNINICNESRAVHSLFKIHGEDCNCFEKYLAYIFRSLLQFPSIIKVTPV